MIKIYNNNIEKALEKLRLLTNKEKKDLKRHEFFESRKARREKPGKTKVISHVR
jgi:ribosomal protein S21